MPYIRHESLFSLQVLYHMDRENRFDVIITGQQSFSRRWIFSPLIAVAAVTKLHAHV